MLGLNVHLLVSVMMSSSSHGSVFLAEYHK
jgi:hypothetical protein